MEPQFNSLPLEMYLREPLLGLELGAAWREAMLLTVRLLHKDAFCGDGMDLTEAEDIKKR